MSHSGSDHFDAERWYRRKMRDRTKAAIDRQDGEFILANAAAPNETLLEHLRDRAKELGYTPYPVEVTGWRLIIRRFGDWGTALHAAGLAYPRGAGSLTDTQRYKAEYLRQQKLHKQEKQRKKQERQQRLEKTARETGLVPAEHK